MLTSHQRQAIDQYFALMDAHPEYFSERENRPIVRDRRIVEQYASETGVVIGLAATSRYVDFVIDLVRSPSGDPPYFPYLRIVYLKQLAGGTNVVIVPVIENPQCGTVGELVLVRQERHATGKTHIEFPRGFGESGVDGQTAALRELQEETGLSGMAATLLGETFTDTGLTDAKVAFYCVAVSNRRPAKPEGTEAISAVVHTSREELWQWIRSGTVNDGFTVQALALWEHFRTS